jgi:transcriptional regulator with GAF, ATPase, and Fis domain
MSFSEVSDHHEVGGARIKSVLGRCGTVATPAAHADRLEFETLISDTSAKLIHASPDELRAAIETALGQVMAFFGATRCGLLTVSADRRRVSIYAASYASGTPQLAGDLDLAELFPWASRRLISRLPTPKRISDLPPEITVDRRTWEALATRSSLMVPIVTGATVSHLIVMGSVAEERDWPVAYVPRLRLLGEMMANAVLRAQAFESLQAALEEVKRLRDRLERENVYLRKEVGQGTGGDLVTGRSPAIRRALQLAGQVAATSTVLLLGETGTGKERFMAYITTPARAGAATWCGSLLGYSGRADGGELFGREGRLYGRVVPTDRCFELARGHAVPRQIGDLPLEVQVKLLRVLQERTIERLGSPTPVPVDVRIIAATNADLEAAVRQGTFRSDLYYRLNVFPIEVPPLRERREDIPVLVETLVEELSLAMRKRFDRLTGQWRRCGTTGRGMSGTAQHPRRAAILSPGPTPTVTPRLHKAVPSAVEAEPDPGQRELHISNASTSCACSKTRAGEFAARTPRPTCWAKPDARSAAWRWGFTAPAPRGSNSQPVNSAPIGEPQWGGLNAYPQATLPVAHHTTRCRCAS